MTSPSPRPNTPPTHRPNASSLDKSSQPKSLFGVYIKGMAMGAADIVPGVSGGTIALIAGIYQRLINALGSIGPSLWQVFRADGGIKDWSPLH